MPGTYTRKSDAGLIPAEAMREAVMLVVGGSKLRKVAAEKGISKSALGRYVKNTSLMNRARCFRITGIAKYSPMNRRNCSRNI